ncbi:unnamed protein product [Spirodela intermedia]|uniref:Uncharacterized protein n=1 Tax=Spirodela intermedia TaxID=51605 RepID=A0A7I8LN11_SPIIN|nr:unnamed protein product [Spirodela intermedia]
MGKTGKACFNIVACGRGSADHDDVEPSESRVLSNKCRWSFRKRSAHHRVLSNTVISEPLPLSKESPNVSRKDSDLPDNPFNFEKLASPKKADDSLPPAVDSVDAEVVDAYPTTEETIKPDPDTSESAAAVIQAAIRGYLARKEFRKLKSVVKLQAAIRGHLVRRQAAGTLRCVQAIVKMQALVRARLLQQSAGAFANQLKLGETCQTNIDTPRSISLDKESSSIKEKRSYSSEKITRNGFARQLLESTPKTKPIHINCDHSRSDSAWKWLERWMTLSTPDIVHEDFNLSSSHQQQKENIKLDASEVADEALVAVHSASPVENLTTSSVPCHEESTIKIASDSETKNNDPSVAEENHAYHEIAEKQLGPSSDGVAALQSASTLQSPDAISDGSEEQSTHFGKSTSSGSLDDEGKKPSFGARKACNPSFAAAQAKFEGLSSASSQKSFNSSKPVSLPSNFAEDSASHDTRLLQAATSECGTEISISSTLDSPDRSETEGGEIVLEIRNLERRDYEEDDGSYDDPSTRAEAFQQPKLKAVNGNSTEVITVAAHSAEAEHQLKPIPSDVKLLQENGIDQDPIGRSTPEGSPRSHITAPESNATPSSQISVNSRRNKGERSLRTRKQRPPVAGAKVSPSNMNNITNSGKGFSEEPTQDAKNGKRRESLGAAVPDNGEPNEPRPSTSNSLPSYMQATESARAKFNANSPKSSPDLHREIYAKKRHSLPLVNGKQDSSPRVQRSSPQSQQNTKQSGANSPYNSAERRWQR